MECRRPRRAWRRAASRRPGSRRLHRAALDRPCESSLRPPPEPLGADDRGASSRPSTSIRGCNQFPRSERPPQIGHRPGIALVPSFQDMRNRAFIALAVARDPGLLRVVLAYLGFNMAEAATWIAILVYAYAIGGAAFAGIAAVVQLVPAGVVAPIAASAGDRFRRDRVLFSGYLLQAVSLGATAFAIESRLPPPVVIGLATVVASSLT